MMIALAQIRSVPIVSKNASICRDLIQQASLQGAKMIFLPEASDTLGLPRENTTTLKRDNVTLNHENTLLKHENTVLNHDQIQRKNECKEFVDQLQESARQNNIYVSVGIHEPVESIEESDESRDKWYNTHLIIDSSGTIVSRYRKIHLFDVSIQNGPTLNESSTTLAGSQLCDPVCTPIGRVGLAICYDLRFPELSTALRINGADILTYPSAFTVKTGSAHWHTLLKARAIENQCYVIASAQVGSHSDKRSSYGHALVVDPWGNIVLDLEQQENIIGLVTLDLDFLARVRRDMPVESHRRTELFSPFEVL